MTSIFDVTVEDGPKLEILDRSPVEKQGVTMTTTQTMRRYRYSDPEQVSPPYQTTGIKGCIPTGAFLGPP